MSATKKDKRKWTMKPRPEAHRQMLQAVAQFWNQKPPGDSGK